MSDHVDMHFETCYTNFLTVMMDTKEQVEKCMGDNEGRQHGHLSAGINLLQFSPGGFYRPLWHPLGNYDGNC